MAEKNESKGDLEPAMRVIMLTVKGKLMIFFGYGIKKIESAVVEH